MAKRETPEPLKPLDWTGLYPPRFESAVPKHIALTMDGNGRWANARGLSRIEGHKAGEAPLLDTVAGAAQAGVEHLSVFAFSTENWVRSPDEVRFLMGFNRQVLRRRRDQLHDWNVRIRWSGRRPKLWTGVIKELEDAEELTKNNTGLTMTMCVNYGSKLEILDAVRAVAKEVQQGKLKPEAIKLSTIQRNMYIPEAPPVDLYIRTSGEQRLSNFQLWQSAYAEVYWEQSLWPDYSREQLWEAISWYTSRERRFGGAQDKPSRSTK